MAQSGTKSPSHTNCSICRGKNREKREAINVALSKNVPYRDIEVMTGTSYRTIGNHAQHLPDIYKQAKEKNILTQAINHQAEIQEQLNFAKSLRLAAREYLSDPNDPMRLVLIPRSNEIEIVYEDVNDCNNRGEPKRKTDTLQNLIVRAEKGGITALKTVARHVDIRTFALDAIKTTDIVLDKNAKLEGLYTKEKENTDEFSQLKKQIEQRAEKRGVTYKEELELYLTIFGSDIKPEIKQELISNSIN